jgi:conjugative relaxase-like TrwC/TraI family protein
MMTVHKIAGIDSPGYADYLTCKGGSARPGDYYLGRSGRPREGMGTWHGRAAEFIELDGSVSPGDMLRVWEGRDPRTGEIVVRRGATGDHVSGIDVTFSAPKSVSVLWALGDPQLRGAVESAHERAVLLALSHIEDNVLLLRRRTEEGIVHEKAAGIIASRFRHHTSRLTAEQFAAGEAPDPQLHDHVVIANMALRRSPDDRGNLWAAIDSRGLYLVAAEAGAVYRAELAHSLQRLGYGVRREGRYFEVEGISAGLRERFSSRSLEVGEAVRRFREQYGRSPTIAERKALTLMTREPKSVDHAPAFEQWAHRAGDAELPRPVFGPPAPVERKAAADAIIRDLTMPTSPRSLTRTSAIFDDRELRIAVAEAAQGRVAGADIPWLIERVRTCDELVSLPGQHWTTRGIWEAEHEVLAVAEARAARRQQVPTEVVEVAISSTRVPLSAEQQDAVRRLSETGFGVLTAQAGAGKGEVLRTVAEVRRATGHRVIALAAAGETAQRFGRDLGADEIMTVESFTRRVAKRRLIISDRDAIFVDEAGLLEDWRWLAITRAAPRGSITVTGDVAQLSPIEAGAIFRDLTKRPDAVTLTENFRARDAWAKDVWSELREGDPLRAVARLERKRRIVISLTRAESLQAAVDQWDTDRRDGAARGRGIEQYLLVTDSSGTEVDRLNAAAQRRRVEAGELGTETVAVAGVHPTAGLRREQLRRGDRVVFTRQVYFGPGRRRVENGETGVLVHIRGGGDAVDVQLADRRVTVRGDSVNALRLGYAQHVYGSQGRTVDRVYAVLGGWQTGRESSYVGVSRAREASTVFSDFSSLEVEGRDRKSALRVLAERIGERRPKVSAVSWVEQWNMKARDGEAGRLDGRRTSVVGTRMQSEPGMSPSASTLDDRARRDLEYREARRRREEEAARSRDGERHR